MELVYHKKKKYFFSWEELMEEGKLWRVNYVIILFSVLYTCTVQYAFYSLEA